MSKLTIKQAADLLGVTPKTLREWERTGHRRYEVSSLLGNKNASTLTVAYARVKPIRNSQLPIRNYN